MVEKEGRRLRSRRDCKELRGILKEIERERKDKRKKYLTRRMWEGRKTQTRDGRN